ncbi:MAG TPA: ABC transporter permease subunit, partial [Casimicrobiaceae bacterium]|nr:ABC transporter permease subunit [Casimicrobiaceae bacterium]
MIFDWQFAWSILPKLARAAEITFMITLASFVASLIGGLLLFGLRMTGRPAIVRPLSFVIDFVRGTPLLVQVFFIYYVAPNYGLRLGPVETGILAM